MVASRSRTRGTAPCSTLVLERGGGLRSKLTSDSDSVPQKTPGCKFSWQSVGGGLALWLHQGHMNPLEPLHVVPWFQKGCVGLRSKTNVRFGRRIRTQHPRKPPGVNFRGNRRWFTFGCIRVTNPWNRSILVPWFQKGVWVSGQN